jgi:hypothetical protein
LANILLRIHEVNRVRLSPLYFLVFLLLSACAADNTRIDTATTSCCPQNHYETFSVTAENIPAFLGPLMVSNFSVAFANRGMQPVIEGGDLNVVLRYEQTNLSRVDEDRDDFEERIATGQTTRFIARIVIEMYDSKTDKIVWSGHVQRLHDVGPGDYMHTGNASIALYDAFTEVLKNYPI